MELLNKFIELVMNTRESFTIEGKNDNSKHRVFVQSNVGKARYIYGEYAYYNRNFHSNLDNKLKLVAIVSDAVVYIVDYFFFDMCNVSVSDYPENIRRFNDKEANVHARDVVFAKYHVSLPVDKSIQEEKINEIKKMAREQLLTDRVTLEEPSIEDIVKLQDVADALCGFIDLDEEVLKRLELNRDGWIYRKSMYENFIQIVNDDYDDIVEGWELDVAKAIKSADAKYLTVEFEANSKRASGKVDPKSVLRVLNEKDYFNNYSFSTRTEGRSLLKELGVKDYGDDDVLRFRNVVKITYGKKVLFEK